MTSLKTKKVYHLLMTSSIFIVLKLEKYSKPVER